MTDECRDLVASQEVVSELIYHTKVEMARLTDDLRGLEDDYALMIRERDEIVAKVVALREKGDCDG